MLTKRIIVLGGSGYLGSAIIRALIAAGYRNVTCGDIAQNRILESEYVKIDLLDSTTLRSSLDEFEVVLNCVGQVTSPFNNCFELNSQGMFNLAQALQETDTRVIQISSVSVYGSAGVCDENSDLNPETNYATAKAFAERILMHQLKSKNLITLRLSNLYGANQGKGVIAYLLRSYHGDRQLQFNNAGDIIRYYLHIEDCIEGIINVVNNESLHGLFNLIGRDKCSIADLISLMEVRYKMKYQVEFTNVPAWENIEYLSDTKLILATSSKPHWQLVKFLDQEVNVE